MDVNPTVDATVRVNGREIIREVSRQVLTYCEDLIHVLEIEPDKIYEVSAEHIVVDGTKYGYCGLMRKSFMRFLIAVNVYRRIDGRATSTKQVREVAQDVISKLNLNIEVEHAMDWLTFEYG